MSIADPRGVAASGSLFADVFPLPLSTFEYFMLVDTRPDYPMMCDLELHFEGAIDRAAFDAALALALPRNPLLNAQIADHGRRGLCWEQTDRQPLVDWAPLGTPLGPRYDQQVDLRSEPGLRVWVRAGLERSTVLFHFHHACADGMGGFAFIEDFLVGYAAAFGGQPAVALRELEPQRLTRREDFGVDQRTRYRKLADWLIGTRESLQFLLQSPQPLAPGSATAGAGPDDTQPVVATPHVSLTCPEDVAVAIRDRAAEAGGTVNDLLLRDLFLTLRRWQNLAAGSASRDRLRILMPQNLRARDDRGLPACNVLSFAFLTRRAGACNDPAELLRSICAETELIRRYRLSLYFLGSLATARANGILNWFLGRRFCFTTVVLTNLGDATRRFVAKLPRSSKGLVVGNLVFQQMTGGPPLRPLTRAAFSIHNSARTITISLKTDPRYFSQLDSQRLLDDYVGQLRSTAEAPSPAAVGSSA